MLAKYYHHDLAHLRQRTREFVAAHPASAGLLAEASADPDVERLLQGSAYLVGLVHERADAAAPELVHALADLLAPHLLCSLPASTIVQFTPRRGDPRACQLVPRGAELATTPVADVACRFRTTQDAHLLPLELHGVHVDASERQAPRLCLRLRAGPAARRAIHAAGAPIRLHLAGDLALTAMLYLWICRHADRLVLRDLAVGSSRELAPARCVVPLGLAPDQALLPWPPLAQPGARLLVEYFAQPAKLLFIDIVGLDLGALVGDDFELAFRCPDAPPLPAPPSAQNIRLGCAPAINLFDAPAVPLRRDLLTAEYPLRPDGIPPAAAEVHTVHAVRSVRPGQPTFLYPDLVAFHRATDPAARACGYYSVLRRPATRGDGVDTTLRILDGERPPEAAREVLSVELSCTNRDLPARMQLGQLCVPTARSPVGVDFRDIAATTRPSPPPLGEPLLWRLLAHLSLGQRALGQLATLRETLKLHDFLGRNDRIAARTNLARVAAIRQVESRPRVHLIDRAPVRGLETTLTLDAAGFAGEGDAFLFGCVLERFLGERLPINSFGALRLLLDPSQVCFSWPSRSGNKTLL